MKTKETEFYAKSPQDALDCLRKQFGEIVFEQDMIFGSRKWASWGDVHAWGFILSEDRNGIIKVTVTAPDNGIKEERSEIARDLREQAEGYGQAADVILAVAKRIENGVRGS